MKEYKYKINGHEYKVNVGDIEMNSRKRRPSSLLSREWHQATTLL